MRLLYPITLVALLAVTTSCLTEATATFTPEVPQETEAPVSDANFNISGVPFQVNNGYVLTVPFPEGEGFVHHLFLTTEDVSAPVHLRGSTATFTVAIYAAAETDLTGIYRVGGEAFTPGNASAASYFPELDFNTDRVFSAFDLPEGTLRLQKEGEEYVVAFETTNERWLHEAKGSFRGKLAPVAVENSAAINDAAFQGPNNLTYGTRAIALNHAYLQRDGHFSNGLPRYRLYLSENDLAPDAANLTGRSDLIFFYVDHAPLSQEGRFAFNLEAGDYIGSLLGGVQSGYYCKNMDFTANSADEDVPVTKGTVVVKHANGEILLAFTTQAASGQETSGIYRGGVVALD